MAAKTLTRLENSSCLLTSIHAEGTFGLRLSVEDSYTYSHAANQYGQQSIPTKSITICLVKVNCTAEASESYRVMWRPGTYRRESSNNICKGFKKLVGSHGSLIRTVRIDEWAWLLAEARGLPIGNGADKKER
ncbi:hypothetical protein M378DRAFT_206790 [Amanita muscaria Koide BX008]|uniref:Uncharacterized protein n=1 Tax=Amanita muscaria (strain Koide BX008) TaxID=946122 RepID=A0A0C2T5N6_AMAMK|nr:hypothetical protein M378DRAFT_206790 [Amanita muscaria Koide BX008]